MLKYCVDMTKLAETRQVDPNKFLAGVDQTKMAVSPVSQDIVSMGADAAKDIVTEEGKKDIDMAIVATESAIDNAKAAAARIHRLLGIQPFARCFKMREACYAAAPAIRLAKDYLAQRPSEKVLVIASDTAHYGIHSGDEPARGADATAVMISHNPSILGLNGDAVVYTEDVHDFWRPTGHQYPLVADTLLKDVYIKSFQESWNEYARRHNKALVDFASLCFHIPFTKMGQRALNSIINHADGTTQDRFNSSYQDAADYNRYVGNTCVGSLYLSLISLLETRDLKGGQAIGLSSYGSDSVGEFFSGTLIDRFKEQLDAERYKSLLNNRIEVSVDEYGHFFRRFDQLELNHELEKSNTGHDIFYLKSIDDNIREYHIAE